MKKTKIIALLLIAVLCVGMFAACSKTEDKKDDSAEAKTFTVGFDAEFPPYGYINDDGDYDGFDLALAEEVCSRLGWTFVAQPIVWESKDAELKSGNIDCIWNGFTRDAEREDSYCWSDPYVDNSIVMVVAANSGISSLADLKGKNVMAQAGSSGLSALENDNVELTETFGQLLECEDYNTAFMDLDSGAIDAIAVDVGVANYQIASRDGDYIILDEPIAKEVYCIGFLLGNDELRDQVWEIVLDMAEDGTMEKIANNYVDVGLVMSSLCLIND